MNILQEHNINHKYWNININLLYSKNKHSKNPKVMTTGNVICELDGNDFLDELDDPQDPVMLESDDEFSDLEDIDEDNQEGNYIHTNNKVISASSMY